jgi:hypothetical protein
MDDRNAVGIVGFEASPVVSQCVESEDVQKSRLRVTLRVTA